LVGFLAANVPRGTKNVHEEEKAHKNQNKSEPYDFVPRGTTNSGRPFYLFPLA
jgi:hypothetical protein